MSGLNGVVSIKSSGMDGKMHEHQYFYVPFHIAAGDKQK